MANFYIKSAHKSQNAEEVWSIIVNHIIQTKNFNSVSGIVYSALIKDDTISYKGGTGVRGEFGEYISKSDFIDGFNAIKKLEKINTNTIKKCISSKLYRKRSPFVGLLKTTGVIE